MYLYQLVRCSGEGLIQGGGQGYSGYCWLGLMYSDNQLIINQLLGLWRCFVISQTSYSTNQPYPTQSMYIPLHFLFLIVKNKNKKQNKQKQMKTEQKHMVLLPPLFPLSLALLLLFLHLFQRLQNTSISLCSMISCSARFSTCKFKVVLGDEQLNVLVLAGQVQW